MADEDFNLEQRWSLLEMHLKTGKSIAGQIIEVMRGRMVVDVLGIQTSLDKFVIGHTYQVTPDIEAEERQLSEEKFRERRRSEAYNSMRGREMLFRVVAVNQTQHMLKLSQKLYTEEEEQSRERRREMLLHKLQHGCSS